MTGAALKDQRNGQKGRDGEGASPNHIRQHIDGASLATDSISNPP